MRRRPSPRTSRARGRGVESGEAGKAGKGNEIVVVVAAAAGGQTKAPPSRRAGQATESWLEWAGASIVAAAASVGRAIPQPTCHTVARVRRVLPGAR